MIETQGEQTMKFSHNGKITFGTKANISDNLVDNVGNFFKNLFSNDKRKESIEEGKTFLNGAISGTFEYEISAELTAEDFQKICIENREDLDITIKKVPELMRSFMDGMKAVRVAIEEELPAWQKIVHDAEIEGSHNLYEEWETDEELQMKREDFTKAKKAKKD